MNQLSVLKNFSHSCLYFDPFPHIVIENALDESIYSKLLHDFPTKQEFIRGEVEEPNRYYWIEARRLLRQYKENCLWKYFVSYHTSPAFLDELITCIKQIDTMDKQPSAEFLLSTHGSVGVRYSNADLDILIDCQATYCSPMIGDPKSPRGPHVDREVTAFTGLLYFKHANNQDKGGDLILYRRKPGVLLTGGFDSSNHISLKYVEEVKRIPYQANTFVGFLNGPQAIHGVSRRQMSCFARQHVNIIIESKSSVFNLNNLEQSKSARTNDWYGNHSYLIK